jgi:hypothetical protein
MSEQQKSPEEQRRADEQRRTEEQRRGAGQRGTVSQRQADAQKKAEETQTYVVKEGQTWGSNPPLEAGDTVELTEAEAAGFEDKLEPADAPKESPAGTEGTTPPPSSPSVPRRTS